MTPLRLMVVALGPVPITAGTTAQGTQGQTRVDRQDLCHRRAAMISTGCMHRRGPGPIATAHQALRRVMVHPDLALIRVANLEVAQVEGARPVVVVTAASFTKAIAGEEFSARLSTTRMRSRWIQSSNKSMPVGIWKQLVVVHD
jgi:hypothetical protein